MAKEPCPSPEQLKAYLLGQLELEQIEEVNRHVEQCPPCEETTATLELHSDTVLEGLRGRKQSQFAGDDDYLRALEFVKNIPQEPADSPAGKDAAAEQAGPPLERLREYELLEKLGEGAMGAVYKARHTKLHKIVAVKVLTSRRMKDAQAVARFEREMQAVGKLEHANIVRAMDAGEVDGAHFLVMEYVNGSDLSQISRKHGPLRVAEACELIRQAAAGLQEAHEHDMVHRDIKPSNLMLAARRNKPPQVKILDMGLALLEGSPQQHELTSTGQLMGTLAYMAPEQGTDSHQVDIRADVYALGATLYKLLSGHQPYSGQKYDSPVKMIRALALESPPSIVERRANLPAELVEIVDRMMARNPEDRFATPQEVADVLQPFCEGADLKPLPTGEPAVEPGTKSPLSATDVGASGSQVDTDVTIEIPSGSTTGVETQWPAIQPEPKSKPQPAARRKVPTGILVASLLGLVAVFFGMVLILHTPNGRVRIEVSDNDLDLEVLVDDGEIKLVDNKWNNKLKARTHRLAIKLDGQTLNIGSPTVFKVNNGDVEHRLTVMLNGAALSSNEFKVVRGKETVLSIKVMPLPRPKPSMPAPASTGDWITLFDGKDASLWSDLGVFQLKNGELVASKVGHAQSRDQYGDFELEFQWRIAAGGNSGVYYRESGDLRVMHIGTAYQLLDNTGNKKYGKNPLTSAGALYGVVPAEVDATLPVGQFNTSRIICRGAKVEHWMNGKRVLAYDLDSEAFQRARSRLKSVGARRKGFIYLQGHTGEVAFRQIRIRKLAPPLAVAPFDSEEAKKHQQAWADYLGVPVEKEIVVGKDKEVKLTMVLIPPGEFLMGSTKEEQARFQKEAKATIDEKWAINGIPNEGPQHRVRITRPFYLGKYEVTQAQWEVVMENNSSQFKENPAHPVAPVSWKGARSFVNKLNDNAASKQIRFAVPTEAQWEHACRSGTTTSWNYGGRKNALSEYAWFGGNSDGKTHPVGQRKPNAFGLHDMHGNAWEVCDDWYATDYYAKSPIDDPRGPGDGEFRVARGGGWRNSEHACRSACRLLQSQWAGMRGVGFRLAASIEMVKAAPAGLPDYALAFEGWNSQVKTPLKYDGTHPITIEAYVTPYAPRHKGYPIILNQATKGLGLIMEPGAWRATWFAADRDEPFAVASKQPPAVDRRIHLAVTCDLKKLALFVDGKKVGSVDVKGKHRASPLPLVMGTDPGPTEYKYLAYLGLIDEVRISKVVRYTGDFKPAKRFATDGDTLALYHFDSGSGDKLVDSSGNGNHGSIAGAKWVHADGLDINPPHRWPADAPPFAVAPFDNAEAKKHQQAWAKYLGVPVEKEIVLGKDKEGKEVKLAMVLVPPGEFLMGATEDELDVAIAWIKSNTRNGVAVTRTAYEGPQHRVQITRPFYLGKYEVTQAQWQAVFDSNPSEFHTDAAHPVENVSWGSANAYCAKLNEILSANDITFALPTEAQWEYSCRAGTTTMWHSGDEEEDLRKVAWYKANSGGTTHPVGKLEPNGFGLFDMHGNVMEWCADWYTLNYYDRHPLNDPIGANKGGHRNLRGGGWIISAVQGCRSAHRGELFPDFKRNYIGFRVALAIDDAKLPRAPAVDPDRAAAEYVLARGGWFKTNLDDARYTTMPEGPFKLTAVMLERGKDVTDNGLAVFRGCTELESLNLRWTEVTDAGLAHFVECNKIKGLSLNRGVSKKGLAYLRDCKELSSIYFSGGGITDEALELFRDWNKLKKVNLNLSRVTDKGTAVLGELPELEWLELQWTAVSDAVIEHLQNCPKLAYLGIGSGVLGSKEEVTDKGLAQLSKLKALTHLVLYPAPGKVTATGAAHFKNCPQLKNLELKFNGTNDILAEVGKCENLEYFYVGTAGSQLTASGFAHLKNCKKLRRLLLDSTPVVTPKVIAELKKALPQCDIKVRGQAPATGDAPPPAVAPFDEAEAKKHQQAWADHLGVPVEKEIVLGKDKVGKEIKLAMMLIPPGEFLMGSTKEEQEKFIKEALAHTDSNAAARIPSEGPQHRVRITRPYYLGKYEVTQQQWQAAMGEEITGNQVSRSQPMVAHWNDSRKLLEKLNERDFAKGGKFSLPSEAQWEYACRAGTTTTWFHGNDEKELRKYAWIKVNPRQQPSIVGQFRANAFGLFDMHGNAFEWCADWYASDYYAKSQLDDPRGPATGKSRVFRGGSCVYFAEICRSAHRCFWPGRESPLGFRLVQSIGDDGQDATDSTAISPDQAAADYVTSLGGKAIMAAGEEKLIYVSLEHCPGVSDKGLALFRDCEHIEHLNLRWTGMPEDALKYFQGCKKLNELRIGPTTTDKVLAFLPQFPELTRLNLCAYRGQITTGGLKQIRECKKLAEATLSWSAVNDETIGEVKNWPKLTMLKLLEPKVLSDKGLAELKTCKQLRSLNVDSTSRFTQQMCDALKAALPDCEIYIDPQIPDDERRAAWWIIAGGGEVQVYNEKPEGFHTVKKSTDLPIGSFKLRSARLQDLPLPRDKSKALANLAACTRLLVLNCDGSKLTDDDLQHFRQCKELREVSLNKTAVTDDGLTHFKAAEQLESLSVSNTAVSDEGLAFLLNLKKLQALNVSNTKVTDAFIEKLKKKFSDCKIDR